MTIYAVYIYDPGDTCDHLGELFTTKEKAEQWIQELKDKSRFHRDYSKFEIKELEVF